MKTILRLAGKILLWLGGVLLLVAILAALSGVFTEKTAPDEVVAPPPVPAPEFSSIEPARAIEDAVVEQIPGTLSATREAIISPRIMSVIAEISVGAGDRVEAGDPLVRLDAQDLAARTQQARQQVAAARARATEAQKEFERMRQLVVQGVVPRSQFDAADAAAKTAQAEVRRTEQAVEEASASAGWASISAPFSGRIVDRYAEPGDTATPGTPILKLYDPSRLRLEAWVGETLAARLRPGMPLPVVIDSLSTTVEGRIEEIVPQAEPGARSMLVKVALPTRDDLYPGMFGRLRIETGRATAVYAPEAAIIRLGQLAWVWVAPEGASPERRYVTLGGGLRHDGWREILSGLSPGDPIAIPK